MKLKIYGALRKFVGIKEFDIEAKTVKEAWSFLIANFDGIEEHIKLQEYCVMAGDIEITLETLNLETDEEIKIIPVVHGEWFWVIPILAGSGGLALAGTIGVKLLGSKLLATLVSTALVTVSTNLIIDGIQQLISPRNPTARDPNLTDPAAIASFNFTGLLNTQKQGTAIPLVYGEVSVGSVIVSAGVDTFQITSKEVVT
tara:strand:+ start:2993 stop:3592 length:600 start_codon:yes stop_codon:yes gene_type:complete